MSEVLGEDEISSLLEAIDGCGGGTKIKLYDFRRPDRFAKEQLRRLSAIFESVCRRMTSDLSAKLQTVCSLHTVSVDQLTYEEFLRIIPSPAAVCNVSWENEKVIAEIDPAIAKEILYTAYKDKADKIRAALHNIDMDEDQQSKAMEIVSSVLHADISDAGAKRYEQYLIKALAVRPILRCLTSELNNSRSHHSQTVMQRDILPPPEHICIEYRPEHIGSVCPTETVILVTIMAMVRDAEGLINICLPYPFVKRSLTDRGILPICTDAGSKYALQTEPGNGCVSLGQFRISEPDTLAVGDIIPLAGRLAGEPLDIIRLPQNEIFAAGEAVVIDESFGVRITEMYDPPKDPDADIQSTLNIKSGNAYARLGQFMIRDGSRYEEGTVIVLDTITGQPADLVLRGSDKVIGRGDILVTDECFSIRVTEILQEIPL